MLVKSRARRARARSNFCLQVAELPFRILRQDFDCFSVLIWTHAMSQQFFPLSFRVSMLTKKLRGHHLLSIVTCFVTIGCQKEVSYHTEYVHPIEDDSVIPLPLVTLTGKLLQHTFPGAPNYENIEDGDAPETRWVLVIPESEIQRLRRSKYIPQEDIYGLEQRGWIQLISPGTEETPIVFLNKEVSVEGHLGTLIFHIHTPITIEATNIYEKIN